MRDAGPLFRQPAKANAVRKPAAPEPIARRNWPAGPSLIEAHPRGLTTFKDLDALAERCAALLAGRPFELAAGVAFYGEFDTMPKQTLYATAAGQREWIACAVPLSPQGHEEDARRLSAAIARAQATSKAA